MSAPAANERSDRPPVWVDAVEVVGNAGITVLRVVGRGLTDRRARWAVGLVQVAGSAGTALLRHRYPRRRSADMRLVSAALDDAKERGALEVAELRRDPAFRAAQGRLSRRAAWMVVYAVGTLATERLLLAELRRRGVRRPHLVTGIAMATIQSTYRVGTLLAERRQQTVSDEP